ncbi:hypothetical protein ACET3Z_003056 [Daucus carota]
MVFVILSIGMSEDLKASKHDTADELIPSKDFEKDMKDLVVSKKEGDVVEMKLDELVCCMLVSPAVLLCVTFLANFFEENALYYFEIKDAGFLDAD